MPKRWSVTLTEAERAHLQGVVQKGQAPARTIRRAHTLLWAAAGQTDGAIAALLHTSIPTVQRTRKRFRQAGLAATLAERPRAGRRRKLDGTQEAYLIAVACSAPPAGQGRWTLRLLANRMVELDIIAAVSDETVRQVLKKRAQALVEAALGNPTPRQRCLRVADGRCARRVYPTR